MPVFFILQYCIAITNALPRSEYIEVCCFLNFFVKHCEELTLCLSNLSDDEILINLTVFSIFKQLLLNALYFLFQLTVIIELTDDSEACLLDFLLKHLVFDVVTILSNILRHLLLELINPLLLQSERELRHF